MIVLLPLTCQTPSQSRLLAKSLLMVSTILFKLIHCRRSCPYQTHIPFSTFQNCGSSSILVFLINFPTFGDSRIVFHLKHQSVHLILCHKLFLALFRILIHRTDLIDLENPFHSSQLSSVRRIAAPVILTSPAVQQ